LAVADGDGVDHEVELVARASDEPCLISLNQRRDVPVMTASTCTHTNE
jgi:hypothetical protein